MDEMNKITILEMCVDGSMERFEELIGPFNAQFNKFYWALRGASVSRSDIDHISFAMVGQTTAFTVFATKEAALRTLGDGAEAPENGVTVHIPITKEV